MKEALWQWMPALRMACMGDDASGILHWKEAGDGEVTAATPEAAMDEIRAFRAQNGRAPKSLKIEGLGSFSFGSSVTEALGESGTVGGRLANKISIVTGSAQGFGYGIAVEMLQEGANVVIADLNMDLAQQKATELCEQFGQGRALAVGVDVSNEESVQDMVSKTVEMYGGLDIFVNNAGVLKAGGLEEMDLRSFEFVTKINYTAYFLCVKYVSQIMKTQHQYQPDYTMDIIQINSKSGLSGSNKNFAYAGGKFGGIGLTQSFALELVPYNIKVNSICPGNFLGGPLWMDPEKGLFVQYLRAGKVPGAKTIEDVREFYESKVPMHRGCECVDVARALFYCVEQQYETGQAIPVTGGQNMLR